jgi:predicted dehydrogenase
MTTVGLIGLGAVVRNIHMPAYSQLGSRMRVIAACDPDSAARTRAKRDWHIPDVFERPAEMLRSTRPDVVAVCTPPWLHREQVLLALDHGCHVFCEKPLADSMAEAGEIVRATEAAAKVVVVNNQFPYMNIHSTAKAMIGTPRFGELLCVHAWHTMRSSEVTEAGWRGELSRRVCFEFGIHVLDLMRFFFDAEPERMLAHMPNPGRRYRSDVVNVINLEFADGRAASILLDRLSKGPERYLDFRLDGEHAAVHTSIGGRVRLEAGLHTREKRPFARFSFVKGGQTVLQDGINRILLARDDANPFAGATARHLTAFLDAIHGGAVPRTAVANNLKSLALVMAAYESAESGRWIDLASHLRHAGT